MGNDRGESNGMLIHVSLYILADKWGVENLKQLTLFKLHQALAALRLGKSNVQDLVDLTRYSYEHTPELEDGIDRLRELICNYIVSNSGLTADHPLFAALLKEGGGLASDLWKIAASKIRMSC